MPAASFLQTSFLGGEWSLSMQGRADDKAYATAMALCYNGILLETGAWTRRPGTQFLATTYNGQPGRTIAFDFKQSTPYTMEFTPLNLRFFNATKLVTTNDDRTVVSISTANPALVTVNAIMAWTTGDQVFFTGLGTSMPLLQNRQFTWTYVSTTSGTISDPVTGATIDGSTLGTLPNNVLISRIVRLTTPFTQSSLSGIRSIQAELQSVLLAPDVAPQILTATPGLPYASFDLEPIDFVDGPYLDPFTNGALITPSATTGIVNFTINFATWLATSVYTKGTFVTYSSNSYKSLVDQNLNNQPDISPTKWQAISPAIAVGPDGFTGSDIGRHMRVYSEPPLWAVGVAYIAGNVVKNADFYYTALTNTTSSLLNAPGGTGSASLAAWSLNPTGANWAWGKITGLLNVVPSAPSGIAHVGNMVNGGGLAAAFDGVIVKPSSTSAAAVTSINLVNGSFSFPTFVGQNYSACTTSSYAISSVTIFPSSDGGMVDVNITGGTTSPGFFLNGSITLSLYGSNSAPVNATNGTLLGFVLADSFSFVPPAIANHPRLFSPISIISNDQTTAYKFLWVTIDTELTTNSFLFITLSNLAAQVQFFAATGSGSTTAGVSVEILGGKLLYTTPITTWRLGLYSGGTGWPTCGTYHEGRLWLSGSVDNRLDASVVGQIFTFSPTALDIGTVTDANAIDYTLDGPDVNAVYWMKPDLQGIIVGTQAGEWLVQATTLNAPLTPTSMQAHRVTSIGCANIEPRRTDHTNLFVQTFQQKLMEYFSDIFSGKFSAPNVALPARHLTSRRLAEIAYQKEPTPMVWSRCNDGSLLGMAYKRDTLMSSQGPAYNGWHQHALGSGNLVTSITDGPSTDGLLDTLTMTTFDSGSGIYCVETLTTPFMETDEVKDAWFLDRAVRPTSFVMGASLQLNGLWHLNGKTVTVYAGGLDLGEWPIENGSTNISWGDDPAGLFTPDFFAEFMGTCPIVVGFTYASRGQLLRPLNPKDVGTPNGPALGKRRRINQMAAIMIQSIAVKFGTKFSKLRQAIFKTEGETPLPPATPFSGVYWDTLDDTHSFDGMICWEIDRPYPCTIAAIEGFIVGQDR